MDEIDPNPFGREYSDAEWAAAVALNLATEKGRGPMVYATGPHHPAQARTRAALARTEAEMWDRLADAMDREWPKELRPSAETTP